MMDARDSGKVVEYLYAIRRTLTDMSKASDRTTKALERIAIALPNNSSSPVDRSILDEPVPVQIDWETPMISGVAQAYNKNGGTEIVITINSPDVERVNALLKGGFVDILRLSVMEE